MALPPLNDEKELLLKLQEGDARAYRALYEHYKAPLAKRLLYLLKSDELAQDTLQDIFLKIWEMHADIDARASFAALLSRMVRNKVTDTYRRAYRDMALRERLATEPEATADAADTRLITREELANIQQALDKLPPRQREVFTLHRIEGKSYREISELLSITPAAINQHIYRATQTLNEVLHPKVWLTVACLGGMAPLA